MTEPITRAGERRGRLSSTTRPLLARQVATAMTSRQATPAILSASKAAPLTRSSAVVPVTAAMRCGTIPSVQPKAATTLARAPRGDSGGTRDQRPGAWHRDDDQRCQKKRGAHTRKAIGRRWIRSPTRAILAARTACMSRRTFRRTPRQSSFLRAKERRHSSSVAAAAGWRGWLLSRFIRRK